MASRIERVSITGDVAELRRRRSAIGAGLSGGAVRYEWLYQEWTAPATYRLNALPFGINHVSVNGLTQREGTDYTVDYTTGVITFTSGVTAADIVSCSYVTTGTLVVSAAEQIISPWNATGWRYKQVARTDATDYSAAAYDDSAWPTGQAPFGADAQGGHDFDAYGGYNTVWTLDTRMWLRRDLGTVPSGTLKAYLRYDNFVSVWWNGALVYADETTGSGGNAVFSATVPSGDVGPSSNVLAIRATDDGPGSPDKAVIDCEVTVVT